MNVNTSLEERERAPTWNTSWGRHWKSRDLAQAEQKVYRCERCAKLRKDQPDRGFWQYGWDGEGDVAIVLACGHFVKVGAPVPPQA